MRDILREHRLPSIVKQNPAVTEVTARKHGVSALCRHRSPRCCYTPRPKIFNLNEDIS